MQRMKYLTLILLLILGINSIVQAQTENTIIAPEVFLRGIRLPDGSVRYTAAITKPTDDTVMRNISVEMTLPPNAPFTEMLVSRQVQFDVVRVNRAGALTLIWQISRVDGNTPLDSFSFTTADPLSGEMEFYIEWQNEDRSQQFVENFFEQPPVIDASKPEGQIAPVQEGYAFVMQTGVQVSVPEHPETFIMNVRILPADFNPPAELGDVWWCSLLEILGMPEGIAADVIVPLRRPVASFTALQLFQQQSDGSWKSLENGAIVTADGQYVMYKHPGGIVATGGDSSIQQEIVPSDQILPQLPGAIDGTSNTTALDEQTSPSNGDGSLSENETPPTDPGTITDGTSNTIVLGEQEAPPNGDGTLPEDETPPTDPNVITDGTSNTIVLGEQEAPPNGDGTLPENETLPTDPDTITDGTSNTIVLDEQTSPSNGDGSLSENETPPTDPGTITDGTSNTIVLGEQTSPPNGDGTLSENETPPTDPNVITDGTSNTLVTGEQTSRDDSQSNTENDATATEISTDPESANTATVQESATATPTAAPPQEPPVNLSPSIILNPLPSTDLVTPPAFGAGGVWVEIIQQNDGGLLQCQVGRVNCALLVRRAGAGVR